MWLTLCASILLIQLPNELTVSQNFCNSCKKFWFWFLVVKFFVSLRVSQKKCWRKVISTTSWSWINPTDMVYFHYSVQFVHWNFMNDNSWSPEHRHHQRGLPPSTRVTFHRNVVNNKGNASTCVPFGITLADPQTAAFSFEPCRTINKRFAWRNPKSQRA